MSAIETCIRFLSVNGDNDLVIAARAELKQLQNAVEGYASQQTKVFDLIQENERLRSTAIAALKPFARHGIGEGLESGERFNIRVSCDEILAASKALKVMEGKG